tara:strand:+ start:1091 stop:1225 length:135 start_codon:yes stop_codon:yes gene_type:complete
MFCWQHKNGHYKSKSSAYPHHSAHDMLQEVDQSDEKIINHLKCF